jgi:hypothetical protein
MGMHGGVDGPGNADDAPGIAGDIAREFQKSIKKSAW